MKKDNTITVFYDEVTRKDIYYLNGIDVTDTIEMLKDKWERQIIDTKCRLFQLDMSVQQRLQDQLALTEKALELACEKCLSFPCSEYCGTRDECETCYYKETYTPEKFKTKAKEMMKSE